MTDLVSSFRNRKVATAEAPIEPAQWTIDSADLALESSPFYDNLKSTLRRGLIYCAIPFVLMVGGLTLFPIPGAVIASGFLTSESAPQRVQSPQTAVVDQIFVHDGDTVVAGQPLVQLNDTNARAELEIASRERDQLAGRLARLSAESRDLDAVLFQEELTSRIGDPFIDSIVAAETKLFQLRLEAYKTQLAQRAEQTTQIAEQVIGVKGQITSAQRQLELLNEQVGNLRQLVQNNLVESSRLNAAEQNLAAIEGQLAQYNATVSLAKARQAELNSQIAELTATRMSTAAAEQSEVQRQYSEVSQRAVAAERSVQQLRLTAPSDGIVSDLRVRTLGGVATASEQVLVITPAGDQLIGELQVSPRDASNIFVGQDAELHFSAIGGSNAPQYSGKVTYLAPDVTIDQRTGVPHFVVRVSINEPINDAARDLDGDLSSGTPVEVFLLREPQPIIAYVARPIIDQAQRAFR